MVTLLFEFVELSIDTVDDSLEKRCLRQFSFLLEPESVNLINKSQSLLQVHAFGPNIARVSRLQSLNKLLVIRQQIDLKLCCRGSLGLASCTSLALLAIATRHEAIVGNRRQIGVCSDNVLQVGTVSSVGILIIQV